ncbi:tellurite resistance protein-related protein [hydrothermal vent metagenome]|uniref:Tellurite resistance protein-related protein n=1 Tax=hydrothermal vent metagenome TaxID=652676 RepID=A0A1W1CGZ2_9ZZZZ
MAIEDKERWDKKYINNHPIPSKVPDVVEKYCLLSKGKKALDIACGTGRNAKFLASKGFEVDALDISPVALNSLKGIKNINTKEVDFDNYTLKENAYDLIVCTYYLNRSLFPQIEKALKEDGLFIFETFMHHPDNTKVPSNRSFLLEDGELELTFDERYEILHLKDFMDEIIFGDKAMKASMVARKKHGGISNKDFWA